MKKKILLILLCGVCMLGVTACGGKSEKEIGTELTKLRKSCDAENDGCPLNYNFQEYLETHSDYRLLNTSQQEFVTKVKEPNSLFNYGNSRDDTCVYKYALFYDTKSKNSYSAKITCNEKRENLKFYDLTLIK